MYAFLGVVRYEDAKLGVIKPEYIVTAPAPQNSKSRFVMQWVPKMNDWTGPIIVVNNFYDADAQALIAFACSTVQVKNKNKVSTTGFSSWSHLRLKGLLFWFECDIYARPTGRALFVCTLPNKSFTPDAWSGDWPLTRRLGHIPDTEELPFVGKPKPAQTTPRNQKKKETCG